MSLPERQGDQPGPVGFIGLGHMGLPMADQILKAGYEVHIWNRTASKSQPLIAKGAVEAATPADLAAHCAIVFTCLSNEQALEAALFGSDGLAIADGNTSLLIDTSTIAWDATQRLASRLHELSGVRLLDAPVSGGPQGARAGTLAVMIGGDYSDVERVRPIIMAYSGRVTHVGPVGYGQIAKACNQIVNFGTMLALAEVFALANSAGIAPETLPQIFDGGFADSNLLKECSRAFDANEKGGILTLVQNLSAKLEGRTPESLRGRLGMAMKDVDIATALGISHDIELPSLAAVSKLMRSLHHGSI